MTYKSEKVFTKMQLIDSLLTSYGYPLHIDKNTYEKYNPYDKVIFNKIMFNDEFLTATIINKEQYPRERYRNIGDAIDYIFIVRFNARVELILDNE